MKKTNYILIGFIMLTLLSCNDSFFDQVPNDRITIEQVFERRKYSEEYLANIYNYIKDEAHRTSPIPWDPCSDDLDVTYDRSGYNSYLMNLGQWNASSGYYNFWTHFYRGIRSATYFMNHIGENTEMISNGEQDLIVRYKAEARFLRAWFYYNLLRQYGPVVIAGEDVLPGDLESDDALMNLPRSTYDECVRYITDELDLAAEDLPAHFTTQQDKDYGRVTRAMCMATKSRVLLLAASPQFNGNIMYSDFRNQDGTSLVGQQYDAGKWEKAAIAAKGIINMNIFSLYKEYDSSGKPDPYLSCRNVFLQPWNSEIIMCRIANGLNNWERSATPRLSSGYESMGATQQLIDEFEMDNGLGIHEGGSGYVETGFSTHPTLTAPAGVWNMYVDREPRFYVNIAYNGAYWIGDGQSQVQLYFTGNSGKKGSWDFPRTGYIAIKNVHPDSNPKTGTYIKRPFVIIRYAETLLNYAEAANEFGGPDYSPDGDGENAYWAINQIRERAGLPALTTGLSQESMRKKIRHERRVELCFEQLRYFDTRRWLVAEETDGGPFWGMNVDTGTKLTDLGFYERTVFETRVFRKNYYLFPIPQSEMDRDNQLVQNPGW